MNYNELIEWLFEKATMRPQLGFAGRDKRAFCWIPGKAAANTEVISRSVNAPLRGATQLAYENWFAPMAGQRCEIVWVGLDIDADDNPMTDLAGINYPGASMVRTSCGGQGVHVIYRLDKPVACTHETAGRIVKLITAPLVEQLGSIHVCKADRRMFWLWGGANQVLKQTDDLLAASYPVELATQVQMVGRGEHVEPTPLIKDWCAKLGLTEFRRSTPIYVGDVVELLRVHGEVVKTKSQCRGNGQLNGYLDLTPTSISLFAYADGHTIWSLTDVEALL